MPHQYISFLDTPEDQVAKMKKMEESFTSLPKTTQSDFYHFLVSMIKDTTLYSKEAHRHAVFCFQHLQQQNLLNEKQQASVFRHLYKLCDTTLFKRRFSFSNAVSITLRDFFESKSFPKSEIKKCYDYLIANMSPISNGYFSAPCKRCWDNTFRKMLNRLNINETEEIKKSIHNITGLNKFRDQLNDSYDKQLNDYMNAFYKRFFMNVKSIRVHDIKSTDKETKIEDKKKQKQGIDKTVFLNDSSKILVEEKFREPKYWKNRETDILLEYISIDNKDVPGWVYTSKSDFLVVLYKNENITDSELYIFPFKPIRQWVKLHHDEFMACRDIIAHNTSWNTISKEVPLEMIMRMIEKEDDKFKRLYKIQDNGNT